MLIEKIILSNGSKLFSVDTIEDIEYLKTLGVDIKQVETKELQKNKAIEARQKAKMNADYNGTNVSLTSNDGNMMIQVKTAFEMGEKHTVLMFENGTKMPISAEEFPSFATWFVKSRNKLFV